MNLLLQGNLGIFCKVLDVQQEVLQEKFQRPYRELVSEKSEEKMTNFSSIYAGRYPGEFLKQNGSPREFVALA